MCKSVLTGSSLSCSRYCRPWRSRWSRRPRLSDTDSTADTRSATVSPRRRGRTYPQSVVRIRHTPRPRRPEPFPSAEVPSSARPASTPVAPETLPADNSCGSSSRPPWSRSGSHDSLAWIEGRTTRRHSAAPSWSCSTRMRRSWTHQSPGRSWAGWGSGLWRGRTLRLASRASQGDAANRQTPSFITLAYNT